MFSSISQGRRIDTIVACLRPEVDLVTQAHMRGIHLASLRITVHGLWLRHAVDKSAVLEQNTPWTSTNSGCGYRSTWQDL